MPNSPTRPTASRRYHRLAGYVPLIYGGFCVLANLGTGGREGDLGVLAGAAVILVGLVHLTRARGCAGAGASGRRFAAASDAGTGLGVRDLD